MNIRPLHKSEIPIVLRLWKDADSSPSITDNVETISGILGREHAAFYVAEIEGAIVGSVIATFDGWRGIVYRLAVHPSRQRKGIARELMRKVEDTFREWGVLRVIAIVDTSRAPAMNFWKASGYKEDGMTRFYKNL
jgi:ribosomal protein S18 acetylase RimI-like enzyme